MFKALLAIVLLTSPLLANYNTTHAYASYPNVKTATNGSNSLKVGTMPNNKTTFLIYGEATVTNASTACILMAFGARNQWEWTGSDILLVTAYSTSAFVIRDGYGDTSLTNAKGPSPLRTVAGIDSGVASWVWKQPIENVSINNQSYSSSYDTNTNVSIYKFEILKTYARNDSLDINIMGPDDIMSTPVAFSVYNGSCPSSGPRYYTKDELLVGGFSFDSLKPSRSTAALLSAIASIYAAVVILGI